MVSHHAVYSLAMKTVTLRLHSAGSRRDRADQSSDTASGRQVRTLNVQGNAGEPFKRNQSDRESKTRAHRDQRPGAEWQVVASGNPVRGTHEAIDGIRTRKLAYFTCRAIRIGKRG